MVVNPSVSIELVIVTVSAIVHLCIFVIIIMYYLLITLWIDTFEASSHLMTVQTIMNVTTGRTCVQSCSVCVNGRERKFLKIL